jgi:uncharacterized phage-associated protein
MEHDARAIANLILDRFNSQVFSISNKKINKLIYLCHGFCLSRFDEPLVRNHFEAWTHGPVVKVVYDAFKDFEWQPIQCRAKTLDYALGELVNVDYSSLPQKTVQLVMRVSEHYINSTANELEELTHEEGGPWATIWGLPEEDRGIRNRIPNPLIKGYFSERWGQRTSTH